MILRSPYPHARVLKVDLTRARALPGVRAAVELLGDDGVVRYVGEEVATVAAVDRRTVAAALEQIEVKYAWLQPATSMEAARAPRAPRVFALLHRHHAPSAVEQPLFPTLWRGNVRGPTSLSRHPLNARRLLAKARRVGDPLLVEGHWTTQAQVHTAFEPHACVARWDGDSLLVHVSTQAAADLRRAIADRFGLAKERVRVVAEHVGGGFGAKLRLTPEAVAAIELARESGAAVRVVLDRHEELTVTGHRLPVEIQVGLLAAWRGVQDGFEHVPGGGVGLGELSSIPIAASLGNAVYNATGWRPRELPMRPDRVLAGVKP